MMDTNIIPSLMAFNISLIMTLIFVFVFSAEKSSKEIKHLAMLCLAATIYVLGQIILNSNQEVGLGILVHRFQHAGILLIIPSWIKFVFEYSVKKKNHFIDFCVWFSILMLPVLFFTGLIITDEPYRYAGRYVQGREGMLYPVLLAMLAASLGYGYYLLVRRYFKHEASRTYDRVMLLGTGVAILAGLHDGLSVLNKTQGITLFEYGLTIMCVALMYSWVIGKGFHEKNAIKNIFNTYISYPLIGKDGAVMGQDSTEPEITVVFADICGYTSLSEQLSTKEIVEVLNKFVASIFDIVEKHDGTFDFVFLCQI